MTFSTSPMANICLCSIDVYALSSSFGFVERHRAGIHASAKSG